MSNDYKHLLTIPYKTRVFFFLNHSYTTLGPQLAYPVHTHHAVTVQKLAGITQFGLVHDLSEDTRVVIKMYFISLVMFSGWWKSSPENRTKIRICTTMRT